MYSNWVIGINISIFYFSYHNDKLNTILFKLSMSSVKYILLKIYTIKIFHAWDVITCYLMNNLIFKQLTYNVYIITIPM